MRGVEIRGGVSQISRLTLGMACMGRGKNPWRLINSKGINNEYNRLEADRVKRIVIVVVVVVVVVVVLE